MDFTRKERRYIKRFDFPTQNPKFVEEVVKYPFSRFGRGKERPKENPNPFGMGLDGFVVLKHLLRREPVVWPDFI